MAALDLDRAAAGSRGRPFYLVMSVLLAALIIGGFSQTVPGDFTEAPYLPLLLHVHGAVFTCWVLLSVAQPALIVGGSLKLHRTLGFVGAGLAAAMVTMGLAATFYAFGHHRVPSFFPPSVFLVMNVLGIAVFGGLVLSAVLLRRQPEWHKRLMLCATVSILSPALGRLLPMSDMGAAAPLVMLAVNWSIGFAGPVHDLVTRRRIHPAYFWGVGAIIVSQVLIMPLAMAPPLVTLARALKVG